MADIVWSGGVTFLRDIQKPSGHSSGQPTIGGPAGAAGFGPNDLQRSLPTPTTLCFCEH